MYTTIYQKIYEYENLLYPLTTTALGYTNYGAAGAGIGLVLGATDLIAINYNFYNKPYLTMATLGASALKPLNLPYYTAEIIGTTASVAILNGDATTAYIEPVKTMLMPYVEPTVIDCSYESVVAPIQGAIAGYNYGKHYGMGGAGAIIGGALGIIDEGLSLYNITHDYYATSALHTMAISNLIIPHIPRVINYVLPDVFGGFKIAPLYLAQSMSKPMMKETIGVAIAAMSLYSNGDQEHEELGEKEQWAVFKVKNDLYKLYDGLISKNKLNDLICKQAITLIANQLIIAKLSLVLSGYNQEFDKYFALLEDEQNSWQNFLTAHKNLGIFLFPYVAGHISNYFINSYFSTQLRYELQDKINDKYLHVDTALYLTHNNFSNDTDSNVLVKKKNDDISVVIDRGNNLLTEGFGAVIQGGYNLIYLSAHNAQDIIMYSSFYNQITNYISTTLAVKASASDAEIEDISAKLKTIEEYIQQHASEMVQTNANDFINSQIIELNSQLRILKETSEIWSTINFCWQIGKSLSDNLYNYLIISDKIYQGEITPNQGAIINRASSSLSDLLGWEASQAGNVIEFDRSVTRLMKLNERMEEVNLEQEHKVQYSYSQANQTAICFKDLKIGVQDESRFHLDELCIKDKRTAIIAKSGGGKSTFLIIVKAITHGQAWGEGEITYFTPTGLEPKITMTQRQYIPPYNSLLELITFKRGEEAKKFESKVKELLEEIKISTDEDKGAAKNLVLRLNNKEDWKSILSDGQIQKIAAIRVILENPDIAILDELLKGLDPSSVEIVEEMLTKYLPSTLFLVVDHHAKANNYNNFYDSALYFTNGTAIIKDMGAIEEYNINESIYTEIIGETHQDQ